MKRNITAYSSSKSWLVQLEIPFRDNKLTGSLKEIKLDGIHVRKIMNNNAWRKGIRYLDRSEDWVAMWQVI